MKVKEMHIQQKLPVLTELMNIHNTYSTNILTRSVICRTFRDRCRFVTARLHYASSGDNLWRANDTEWPFYSYPITAIYSRL